MALPMGPEADRIQEAQALIRAINRLWETISETKAAYVRLAEVHAKAMHAQVDATHALREALTVASASQLALTERLDTNAGRQRWIDHLVGAVIGAGLVLLTAYVAEQGPFAPAQVPAPGTAPPPAVPALPPAQPQP